MSLNESKNDVEEKKYSLYMIYSGKSLKQIFEFICNYIEDESDIGPIRIDHDREEGALLDSNRTLVILKNDVFTRLSKDGYNQPNGFEDFRIVPYRFHKGSHPRSGNYSLFVKLPLDKIPYEECHVKLIEKINVLIKYGFLTEKDFTIYSPVKSRESEIPEYKGYSIISFGKIKREMVILTKIVLDQSKWNDENFSHVSWFRKETKKKKPYYRKRMIKKPKEVKKDVELVFPEVEDEDVGIEEMAHVLGKTLLAEK